MAVSENRGYEQEQEWVEHVIRIYRNATVVKGGRRFSFSALVVVGDGKGRVGMGYGKANEVPSAVEKGFKDARRNLVRVPVIDGTIPHEVVGRYQATRVILAPAAPGSGLTACSQVRAVLQAAGIHNILSKCHRIANPKNLVKATMLGLLQLRTIEEAERLRGKKLARV
jgi:small subunit ribosomal protein S5